MIGRAVLSLFAALVVAVFVQEVVSKAMMNKAPVGWNSSRATTVSSSFLGSVRIPRSADGHYHAEILVDRTPIRVMIDTGASVLALRESDAIAAGLHVMPSDFRHQMDTANGSVMAAAVQADEIELGSFRVERVNVAVLKDEALFQSLLGMNVLSRLGQVQFNEAELLIEARN